MQRSDETNKLVEALISFHELVEPVRKTEEGQAGPRRYRYADLAAVSAAVRGPLCSTGLTITHTFQTAPAAAECTMERVDRGGQVTAIRTQALALLTTRLSHQSGQWIESTLPVVAEWCDPQRLGSVITYLRRYAVLAILDLATEDDDGASAIRRDRPAPERRRERQRPAAPAAAEAYQAPPTIAEQAPAAERPARNGGWLYRQAEKKGALQWFLDYGHDHGYPRRLVDWSELMVARALDARRAANAQPPTNGEPR
jgi:hypothetical protein